MDAHEKLPPEARNIIKDSSSVCINFCSYYKPGKAEDLACEGFMTIERLMKEGRRFSLGRDDEDACHEMPEISRRVCARCSFREDGCDFAAGQKGARPCGGLLLIGRLIGSGELRVDDVLNID